MAELARDRGIVLGTRDHAETDRIAILLTPRGRLDLPAEGPLALTRLRAPEGDLRQALTLLGKFRRAQVRR